VFFFFRMEREEFSEISPVEFYNLLQDSGRSKLIIDCRDQLSFEESCIRNAINVTSSDLSIAKCTKYAWDENKCTLKDSTKDFRFRRVPGIYEFIVIYDTDGGDSCRAIATAITQEGKINKTNISVLKGGFQTFERQYPSLSSSMRKEKRALEGLMPSELVAGFLYLGSNDSARNKKHLEALGITHILNMADELENAFPGDFSYKKCGVNDTITGSNFHEFFKDALEFIDDAQRQFGKKVFVHCAMGISRSPAIAIAWLMKHNKWSFEEANAYVKTQRRCIHPNPGFTQYLQQFEQELQSL